MTWRDHGSIAVIIDCWDHSQYPVGSNNHQLCQELAQNILDIVPTLPNLTAVVLSTYDGYEAHDPALRSSNLYYKNTHDLLYVEQPIPYVRRWYERDFVRSEPRVTQPGEIENRTSSQILSHRWPCQQLAMNDIWQLEYYMHNVVPHAKNVFYFGRSWNHSHDVPGCVRGRPMGADRLCELKQWSHLPDVNVFLHSRGILDKHPTQDIFLWPSFDQYIKIDQDIYQYC